MGSYPNESGWQRDRLRQMQRAAPIQRFHSVIRYRPGARDILATSESRHFDRRRALEDFFFPTGSHHASARQNQQLRSEPIRFFHVMRYEQRRPAIRGKSLLELYLDLASQMRI